MRLRIEHVTTYSYARPVTFNRHRLVLRPREGHDTRVERMDLQLSPIHHVEWIRDVFGNSIALVDWLAAADTLTITNHVELERLSLFPRKELHEPWRVPFPPQYDPLESAITGVYAAPTYGDDVGVLQTWLAKDPIINPSDSEGSMLALCRRISSAIKYVRRTERGVQTPQQTLGLASGSCRDMATLMMDAARVLGVAARFVSGYLHGSASIAGVASTHAWTEVYLPMLGWRGFDPTIGDPIGMNHIVVGVSTHPRGVMPISGTFIGGTTDHRGLHVTVKTVVLPDAEAANGVLHDTVT
jgi:transglutaminase-like putative cysteine protease